MVDWFLRGLLFRADHRFEGSALRSPDASDWHDSRHASWGGQPSHWWPSDLGGPARLVVVQQRGATPLCSVSS